MASTPSSRSVTSLYLANLHPSVTELILYEKFRPVGPILSIRVCRDPVTEKPYGYAYVNFQSVVDAQKVVDTMNYDVICGQPVRIMWSVHDPSLYKSGVFIKNLDSGIDNKALHTMFSAFGKILSVHVTGDEKRSGVVQFERPEDAQKAIHKMQGMLVNDHKISVGQFKARSKREMETKATKEFTNIYVKNFGQEVDDGKLKGLFDSFGHMLSVKVMTDGLGKSKGFGFVNFERPEDAQKAVDEMNGKDMNGKIIYVGPAQKKIDRQCELKKRFEQLVRDRIMKTQSTNLYVKNLHLAIDDERLRKEFSSFGTITSAKVMTEDGRSKGFGFVCFSTPEEAKKAISEMNGKIVAMKPLYVSLAQRREERQAHLTDLFMQRLASGRVPPNLASLYQLPSFNTMATIPSAAQIHLSCYKNRHIAQVRPNVPWKSHSAKPLPFLNVLAGIQASTPRLPTFNTMRSIQGVVHSPTQKMVQQTTVSTAISPSHSGPQYMYNSSARNLQQNLNNTPHVSMQQAAVHVKGQRHLTATILSSASPEEQKDMLGEHLYPMVLALQPTMSRKITGMLLELDNSELLHLLESPESLHSMVNEAVEVLQAHQAKETLHKVIKTEVV